MKVKLQNVVVHFPQLIEAKEFRPGDGNPRRSATFAIDPKQAGSVKALDDAMADAAASKWAAKGPAILGELIKKGKVGFVKGPKTSEAGEEYDGFEGMYHLSASRSAKQGIVGVFGRDRAPITEGGVITSGSIVNVIVEPWAQDNTFGRRINFDLISVQYVGESGVTYGGGKKPTADDFDDLSVEDADALAS